MILPVSWGSSGRNLIRELCRVAEPDCVRLVWNALQLYERSGAHDWTRVFRGNRYGVCVGGLVVPEVIVEGQVRVILPLCRELVCLLDDGVPLAHCVCPQPGVVLTLGNGSHCEMRHNPKVVHAAAEGEVEIRMGVLVYHCCGSVGENKLLNNQILTGRCISSLELFHLPHTRTRCPWPAQI